MSQSQIVHHLRTAPLGRFQVPYLAATLQVSEADVRCAMAQVRIVDLGLGWYAVVQS